MVSNAATHRGVDPNDANALMMGESGGDPNIVNTNKNGTQDHGLFQINDTNIHPGEEDNALDPEWNTGRGLDLYKAGLDKFNGDPATAAYAYNHGMGAAEKATPDQVQKDPYVQKFMANRAPQQPIATQGIPTAQEMNPDNAFTDDQPGAAVRRVGTKVQPGTALQPPPPYNPSAAAAAAPPGSHSPVNAAPVVPPVQGPSPSYFEGFGSNLGNGLMRGFALLGHAVGVFGGAGAAVAGSLNNPGGGPNQGQAAADTYFKHLDSFINNHPWANPQHWTPDKPGGTGAQIVGDTAAMAAPLLTGPLGTTLMVTSAMANGSVDAVDANKSLDTAIKVGLLNAASTAAGIKAPGLLKSFPLWTRILGGAGANIAINPLAETATKKILNDPGYQGAVQEFKKALTDPKSFIENTLMGAIFGALTHEGGAKAPKPAPDTQPSPAAATALKPGTDGNEPPPPPGPSPAASTAPIKPVPAAPAVADTPTAEPAKQIREQLASMRLGNKDGVLVSTETQAHLDSLPDGHEHGDTVKRQITQAQTQGRTVDTDTGTLVLPNQKAAGVVRSRLAAGEDPQSVIGRVTGAGGGKSPDQTVVVQGRAADGSVIHETTVAPAAEAVTRQAMVERGTIPVTMTPEGVINERTQSVNAEKAEAQIGAPGFDEQDNRGAPDRREADSPVDTDQRVEDRRVVSAENARLTKARADVVHKPDDVFSPEAHADDKASAAFDALPPEHQAGVTDIMNEEGRTRDSAMKIWKTRNPEEAAAPKEEAPAPATKEAEPAAPASPKEPVIEPKVPDTARAGYFKTDSGTEVAVHVGEKAPDGRVMVHPLDDSGEPGAGRLVPAESVRTNATSSEPVHEAEPVKTKGSPLEQLPAALKLHETQEAKVAGKKNATKLPERVANASAFATALKAAAKGVEGDAGSRAAEAASQVLQRADNVRDTGKGLWTSHAQITKRVDEMHAAARELLGQPEPVADKPVVADKVADKPAEKPVTKPPEEGGSVKPKYTELGKGKPKNRVQAIKALMRAEGLSYGDASRKVIADEIAAAKPKEKATVATEKEANRARDLIRNAVEAKPEDLSKASDALVAHIHAVATRLGHPADQIAAEVDAWLRHVQTQRDANAIPEDEQPPEVSDEQRKELTGPRGEAAGISKVFRPSGGPGIVRALLNRWHGHTVAMMREMEDLGRHLTDSGLVAKMRDMRDTGIPMSSHEILDHLIEQAKTKGEGLKQRLIALRAQSPDVPTFIRSNTVNPHTLEVYGPGFKGMFAAQSDAPSIQIRLHDGDINGVGGTTAYRIVHTIMHEVDHSAVMYETKTNPDGKLATQLKSALSILVSRLGAKYKAEGKASGFNDYVNSLSGEPGSMFTPVDQSEFGHLYGIKNIDEMMSELHSNPQFLEEVIRSEDFKQKGEYIPPTGMRKGIPGLLMKIVNAVAEHMGYKNPELALHMMDLHDTAADVQRMKFPSMYDEGALYRANANLDPDYVRALGAAPGEGRSGYIDASARPDDIAFSQARDAEDDKNELQRPSRPVKAEGAIRAAIGDEATDKIRDTVHALTSSKLVDLGRKTTFALKSVGQIFRDGKRFFGNDDAANPLNKIRESEWARQVRVHKGQEIVNPVVREWNGLSNHDNLAVAGLLRDSSLWKIDPRTAADQQLPATSARAGFAARHADMENSYKGLSPVARRVYDGALVASKALRVMERKSAVDTANQAFELGLNSEQLKHLYGAKNEGALKGLLKPRGAVDVGPKNAKVLAALKSWVGSDIDGPYAHLGRDGQYVVKATNESAPEGQSFANEAKARAFAEQVSNESPNSTATVRNAGANDWRVDYKVDHVSMHDSQNDALQARRALLDAGYKSPLVSTKVYDHTEAKSLDPGMHELMTAAISRIERGGTDKGTKALIDSLHSAYLEKQATRSASASSQLTRKGFAGVKASEMRRNFADHATSTIWHSAQISTMFERADAMATLRTMASSDAGNDIGRPVSQDTMFKRGEIVHTLAARAATDAEINTGGFLNRQTARLGFLNYLTSPAHAVIWGTQNFTTTIPGLAAEHGQLPARAAMYKAMGVVMSPALRTGMHEQFSRWNADGGPSPENIQTAIQNAVAKSGMNRFAPALKILHERGVISHGFANSLNEIARGTWPSVLKVMDYARMMPTMTDAFNRTSTALASLELNVKNPDDPEDLANGLRKAADDVEKYHADYSAANKPRAFQAVNKIWGGNTLTMMMTYSQAMAHLAYGNIAEVIKAVPGLRSDVGEQTQNQRSWQAAKTLGGLAVGSFLYTGVYGVAGIAPAHLAVYAYHKIFDKEGEYFDMKNAIHGWLTDLAGPTVGNYLARGPIAQGLGIDLQERMGFANIIFHDMPDILSGDKDAWKNFVNDEAGALVQMVGKNAMGAMGKLINGDVPGAISSMIPLKVYQDGAQGYELAHTGKLNSAGVPITKPSSLDAAKKTFGFLPADVADAQEKHRVATGITKAQSLARTAIVRAIISAPPGSPEAVAAWDRSNSFNARNPGAWISSGEIQGTTNKDLKIQYGVPLGKENQQVTDQTRWDQP
jgi:hypothetical protein